MDSKVIGEIRDGILGYMAQKVAMFADQPVDALPAIYEGCFGIAEKELLSSINANGFEVSVSEWNAAFAAAQLSAQELCEFDVRAKLYGATLIELRNQCEAHA